MKPEDFIENPSNLTVASEAEASSARLAESEVEDEPEEIAKTNAVLKLAENDKAQRDKTPAKVPKARFRKAIWQSMGNMSALARLLEVNYSSLRGYLAVHKNLAQLMDAARSQLVDKAEEFIISCLTDGDIDARTKADLAKFIVKTQGKDRGWNEAPTVATQINVQSDNVDIKSIFGIPSQTNDNT